MSGAQKKKTERRKKGLQLCSPFFCKKIRFRMMHEE
nr:MAG TPA: hypothetical protein [Caudoviricetes sp.]